MALQKLTEDFLYADILHSAAACQDSCEQVSNPSKLIKRLLPATL